MDMNNTSNRAACWRYLVWIIYCYCFENLEGKKNVFYPILSFASVSLSFSRVNDSQHEEPSKNDARPSHLTKTRFIITGTVALNLLCSFISAFQIQIAFVVGVLRIYRLLSAHIMLNNDWHTPRFCSLVIMFFCWQDSTLLHIINIWTCARISISPIAMTPFSASCVHCDIKAGRADVQVLTFLSQKRACFVANILTVCASLCCLMFKWYLSWNSLFFKTYYAKMLSVEC